jgi:4-amino-4-deoxy-L-arabinose transferase-like glycosyltransferase
LNRRLAYPVVGFLCALPRLVVLFHERAAITAAYREKSDVFAQTFVHSGTYGFLPGEPSAYTQPLYGWFLVPVYWLFGRSWLSIGLSQTALAVGVALLVFEIGRRLFGGRAGIVAAGLTTLNPYLVWHDVHLNREIVDQVCAAALVLVTLALTSRPSKKLAALLGAVGGLAVLGNARLLELPVLCAAFLLWQLPKTRTTGILAALVLAGAAVTLAPWLVRNRAELGCWTITTDGRALWKANNPQTYRLLSSGQWIDDVKPPFPRPPRPNEWTPEEAYGFAQGGNLTAAYAAYPNECAAMSFYEDLAYRWAISHPGEKARLALLSAKLLWQPSVFETADRNRSGSRLDSGRELVEPLYMTLMYALALFGLLLAPRRFVALALILLAYDTLAAFVFVGATRYRIAWDFLVALLATAALARSAVFVQGGRRPAESQT